MGETPWYSNWLFYGIELPFDPVIPILGIYPKNPGALIRKNICTPMFIAALFTIAKIWKQPKYPLVDEWIKKRKKKKWYIYTMEYYAAVKNNDLLPFGTAWMELEIIMLNEVSQWK